MANRYFYKNHYSLEVDIVNLYGLINVGAAGAVSSIKGGGVVSVVKNVTAGNYTITFADKFSHFFGLKAVVISPTINTVANVQILATPATIQADIASTKQVTIQLLDYAGLAVDAPSGASINFEGKFRVSSIGRFD